MANSKQGAVRCKDVLIAAIIPLYNGAPYIQQAIESVLHQSLPPTEIIVVDDGSTDGGPQIVAKLAREHPIRLLHKPNGGQGSTRNFGIGNSGCDLIALLDQVRRPGARMAPTISISTCCQVGAVKPCWNGCIQAASLVDTNRPETPSVMHPPESVFGERLSATELTANPPIHHI
jgi:glycosyltransferase involved in cell wall biosynthesis